MPTFLLVLFFAIYAAAHAQFDFNSVQTSFQSYNNLLVGHDYMAAVEFLPEESYQVIGKREMASRLGFLRGEGSYIQLNPAQNITVFLLGTIEGKDYALVKYNNVLSMTVTEADARSTLKEELPEEYSNDMSTAEVYAQLGALMYENGVAELETQTNDTSVTYKISSKMKSIAVSPHGRADWKFAQASATDDVITPYYLPRDIIEKAARY